MKTDMDELKKRLRKGTLAIANAKINLSIDILGIKPENGYHLLEMIMQQISLFDRLFFFVGSDSDILPEATPIDEKISLACNTRRLPLNEKNLVYKAAKLITDAYGIDDKISVYIEKHIPSGGGLGGGSADAAAVLKAINNIYTLGIGWDKLEVLSSRLGSDVPFFIRGGASLATGIGTDLSRLPSLNGGCLLLVNPNLFLSTERVYKTLDQMGVPPEAHPDTQLLIKALNNRDIYTFAANMKNVLELPAFMLCPTVRELKASILNHGAIGAMMSGSGATVFGIYDDDKKAYDAMTYYRQQGYFAAISEM